MEEIPEEVLATFPYRDMWCELQEYAYTRGWKEVISYMENVEETEYEVFQDKNPSEEEVLEGGYF